MKPETTLPQKLFLGCFGLGLLAVALLLLEGILATTGIGDEHRFADPYVGFAPGSSLFARNGASYETRPGKLAFFEAQRFAVEKPARGYRIFALGGSTTAGRPYDGRLAFPAWLGRYLEARAPTRNWEVVNAGAISYASYRIVLLMKELVRYEPDLFVVYTGHNEFLEERSYGDLKRQSPFWQGLQVRLAGSRLWSLARHEVEQRRQRRSSASVMEAEVVTKLEGWTGLERYRRDDALADAVSEHFAFNLGQMIALARDAGADIVFVDPVENLKDFSPFKSEHRAGLSTADQRRFEALFEQGRAALVPEEPAAGATTPNASSAADPAAARALLDEARTIDGEWAALHFWAGRAHLALGDIEAARDAFLRAKDLDVAPLRMLERQRRTLHTVTDDAGVPRIDLPGLLAADSRARFGHDILGEDYLLDHVHPTPAVHGLIAEQVLAVLTERGVLDDDPSWNLARRQAIDRAVLDTIDHRVQAQRDLNLAKVLGWAGKLAEAETSLQRAQAVLGDDPDVQLALGIVYAKTGRPARAEQALRTAIAAAPDIAEAHFNLGVVTGRLGRIDEGIDALEVALRLRPGYAEALFNLGVLRRERGDHADAEAIFEQILAQDPGALEARLARAVTWRRQGRFDDAAGAFEAVLASEPDNVDARIDLAITRAHQGALDDAAHHLAQALALDGGHPEALYNLGLVEAARGDLRAARDAYERALVTRPDHAEAHNNLGILHARSGALDDALSHVERAVEARPGYADAWLNLGVVHEMRGELDEAADAVRQALRHDPRQPRYHLVLGLIEVRRGRLDAARPLLATAEAGGLDVPPEAKRRLAAPD